MIKNEKKSQPPIDSGKAENEFLGTPNDEKQSADVEDEKLSKNDFVERLERSVENLWYMSETDAEIKIFVGEKADAVTGEILVKQANISPEKKVEEQDFAGFFKNLTEMQDWFGDEEKQTAEKFSTVENLLEENLKDLKVFKIGEIEIDIYVVGLDSQGVLSGITTKAVET